MFVKHACHIVDILKFLYELNIIKMYLHRNCDMGNVTALIRSHCMYGRRFPKKNIIHGEFCESKHRQGEQRLTYKNINDCEEIVTDHPNWSRNMIIHHGNPNIQSAVVLKIYTQDFYVIHGHKNNF